MLIYNFGDWTSWNEPQKVTFLPEQKLILINPGHSQIDVQIDLYSAWKEWIRYYDNAKWAAAFTTFGGDSTGESQYAPRYYFLTNGWKVLVRDMSVVVQMNLYSDDGLSPFVIENAAVTNRASDVPIIKSEVEQRLDYGDRVYFDQDSSFSGTDYPNGTIAQPVNDLDDALSIAALYNISNIYSLSDINFILSGTSYQNLSFFADRENITVNISEGIYINNIDWNGFIINGNFGGGENKFVDCVIINALDVSGQMRSCQMNGTVRVWNNVVASLCYSGIAGSATPVFDMHEFRPTRLSIRSYSGGIDLLWSNFPQDVATIELIAGQVILEPSCTVGYIDIRGVGYITDNSSGATVKTTGFIDSFENYIEETRETDERLAYGDRIYYDQTSIFTGITYPVGTIVQPVNNILDAITLTELYNITSFHVLSDVSVFNITGSTIEGYSIFGQRENLNLILENNIYNDMLFQNFNVIADFENSTLNTLEKCNIIFLQNFKGVIRDSKMVGNIHLIGDTDLINNYSGDDLNTPLKEIPKIILESDNGIALDIRNYSGDIQFSKVDNPNDRITIDMGAGRVILDSGCTSGVIDLRGVGYIENNAGTGCTIITTGFVDSFGSYIEDSRLLDEQLSYNNRLYINQLSGFTGSTYPVGTQAQPCSSELDLFILAQSLNIQNIYVKYELSLIDLPFTASDFNAFSDTPHARLTIDYISGSRLKNVKLEGFSILNSDFTGNAHYYDRCIIGDVKGLAGHLVECDLTGQGNIIEIYNNTTFAFCHPRIAGDVPKIKMSNPSGTTCAFAGWNGDLIIDEMSHANDRMIIDVNSGSIVINSACTNGRIDIRGIGDIIDNSTGNCLVVRDGQIQGSPVEYNGEIVVDVINGSTGSVYPYGSDQEPVNNLSDAISLLNRYKMNKIKVVGSLTINNGEDLSGIAFSAERSTNNYLFITSAITNSIFIQNLTVNATQSGSTRYTNSVILGVENFDGGIKDCLLIGGINVTGDGSNYITDCATYTNNTNNKVKIYVNDKKLNMMRMTGFYEIATKTGTDTTTIDMMGGILEIGSGCTSGVIYIGGVCEVIDNSGVGCTVINQSISKKTIEDSTWNATITDHQEVNTTGYALYNVSAGATPEVIAEAVWSINITGITSEGTAAQTLTHILELNTGSTIKLNTVYDDVKRVLGLTQENFLIRDHVYSSDDLLQSAVIKLFENSVDCENEINPIAEYEMTALYDSKGRLTNYKVTKI